MPSTDMGKWAGWLLVLALGCFAVFFGFVLAGQRGGDTFFSNLTLTIPILISAAAIAGGVTGVMARRRHDRSLVVKLATFVGAVVVLWIAAEIAFPH